MMRRLSTLLIALVLVPVFCLPAQAVAPDEVREYLLSQAAADFATHGPEPESIREVRLRYLEDDDGKRVYLLCGQFLPKPGRAKPAWTHFATLKTGGYEQWIGGQAAALCSQSLPLSSPSEDLSSELQRRLVGDHSAEE